MSSPLDIGCGTKKNYRGCIIFFLILDVVFDPRGMTQSLEGVVRWIKAKLLFIVLNVVNMRLNKWATYKLLRHPTTNKNSEK